MRLLVCDSMQWCAYTLPVLQKSILAYRYVVTATLAIRGWVHTISLLILLQTDAFSCYYLTFRHFRYCFNTFGIVRGIPSCHTFLSQTLLLLPTHLPPSDASSTFWCIFCLLICLLPLDASSTFRCVSCLQMRLPLRDSSSASRPVSRTASHHGPVFRLPSHSIPWLLGLPPRSRDIPQCLARSAQHLPWHPLHCYVFRCTAARSGHTASLPPLCNTFLSPT